MTPEQKELFDKLKPLQQKVATNVISGMSYIDAYKAAGGKAKTDESARASVSQILTNLNVKAFIDSMKEDMVSDAVMSRQEMLETLTRISRVNLPVDSKGYLDLTQLTDAQRESLEQVQIADNGVKAKNYSKLAAMKQLADLAGYNAPTKTEHSGVIQQVNYSADDYKSAQEALEGKLS